MLQITIIIGIVLLFFLIIAALGQIYNNCIGQEEGKTLFYGFFLYFALFEIVGLPMILTQKHLSSLCVIWGIVVAIILIAGCFIFLKGAKKPKIVIENRKLWTAAILLLLFQIVIALLHPNNSWDTAFYIGGVVKSVQTDTMYIYDGYTGWKDSAINLKYAMCSFYMHDAVISAISGVHAAIVCRLFNTLVCQLFSAYVVYCLGNEIWGESRSSCLMVIFWITTNLGISTEYFASTFLLTRSYEAKAFCANIVIPGVIYLLIRIIKNPAVRTNWINLLILNISSVAISSSGLLLIPLLEGIILLVMTVIKRKPVYIWKIFICELPCVFYLGLYFVNHFNLLKIVIA